MTPEDLLTFEADIAAKVACCLMSAKQGRYERRKAKWRFRFANEPEFRAKHREKTKVASRKYISAKVADNPDFYKDRYWEDAERAKAHSRKWQEIPENRVSVLIRNRIADARKNNLPFDRDALLGLLDGPIDHCQLCSKKLNYSFIKGTRPDGPSIDRVIPIRGYVSGNIAILCNACNVKKGAATADEHRRIADFIESYIERLD